MTTFGFFGPALGGHDGWVTTQGEVLANLFASEGERVFVSSTRLSPIARAAEHARDLLRWRRQIDVAVVSVFSGRAFALADESLTLARSLGIPTVAWLHGGNLPAFAEQHPRWARRVLRQSDAVVAPSAFLAHWASTLRKSTQVIPNVLELDTYQFRARSLIRPRLLWMRTFQALYDPATAVRTVAELRRRGVNAHLTMAGQDKGLQGPSMILARDLGVNDSVTFAGFAAGQAKADLFDSHDIFLNTNLVDNAPVTVLEACASGLVVVSTNVGGIPALLVEGESAILVPPASPEAMADAVADLVADPARGRRIAQSARQVANRSGWEVVRSQWCELGHELAG